MVGDLSTGLPLACLIGKHIFPRAYGAAAGYLAARGVNDDWMLLAPAAAGAIILLGRLVTAPFVVYRDGATATAASYGAAEPRQIHPNDASTLIRTMRDGIGNWLALVQDRGAAEGWNEPRLRHEIAVVQRLQVASIGSDSETLTYRNGIAQALSDAGLEVLLDEWPPGLPEYAKFNTEAVIVLDGKTPNPLRSAVLAALRDAGIATREMHVDWVHLPTQGRRHAGANVLTLVIGRHRSGSA